MFLSHNHREVNAGAWIVPLFLATAVALMAISENALAATVIKPTGSMKMVTESAKFNFGSTAINCESGEVTGTLPNPAAVEAQLNNPVFQNSGGAECTTTGMEGAKFQVVAHSEPTNSFRLAAQSLTSGQLKFPSGEGLEFISGKCKLWTFKAESLTGEWANGKDGKPATPSTFSLSEAKANIKENVAEWEANCPSALVSDLKANKIVTLTATFSVTATSFPNFAVVFE